MQTPRDPKVIIHLPLAASRAIWALSSIPKHMFNNLGRNDFVYKNYSERGTKVDAPQHLKAILLNHAPASLHL